MTRVHAFTDDALGDHDAVGLVQQLHAGAASPSEVVEAAIARVEKVDPELNAVAYAAFDRARAEAAAPGPGYFSGVPSMLKDNVDAEGMPTLHGADAWIGRPARRDGDFARMFHATGLITLGKTQMPEFGFNASGEHPRLRPTRNPWRTAYSAGGSSSGAAALVASGALPIAHAVDGGGSTRIPAAVNGLVGLKPTRDRLPQDRMLRQMPVRIISDGVLTRSVRDTAAFYREAEKVWRNLKLPPVGDLTRPGRNRLKVAMVTRSVETDCTPEVREHTLKTGAFLEELGHRVEEIPPPVPAYFVDDFLAYWGLLALFTVRAGRRTFGRSFDRTRLDNLTLGLATHAQRNLHRMPVAIARLNRSRRFSATLFEQYDVLLTPTLAAETPPIGHLDPTADYAQIRERLLAWVAFTPLQNATGDPAISLPLARSADGMPLGMMFAAGAGREAMLIELGYELEETRPFARIQD